MARFKSVFSFGIDEDQLTGLTPQEVFVLGFEMGQVWDIAYEGGSCICKLVHAENKDRIERALTQNGRQYTLGWMDNDPAELWMLLTVLPTSDTKQRG